MKEEKLEFSNEKLEHVNFFKEEEEGFINLSKPNDEYQKEKKLENEKYEKQIGYLAYLGQDTNEITGNVSWYNKIPERFKDVDQKEVKTESKSIIDPLNIINFYLKNKDTPHSENSSNRVSKEISSTCFKTEQFEVKAESSKHSAKKKKKKKKDGKKEKKKSKKKKYKKFDDSRSDKDDRKCAELAKLREKRLKRELNERIRAAELLAKRNGLTTEVTTQLPVSKYNSQFNPHLARQNQY